MTFANEFVSEDDITKYGLDELLSEFNSFGWKHGRPAGFRHTWTVDRSRNALLVHVKQQQVVGPSGRNEPGAEHIFAFVVDGVRWLIRVDKTGTSSSIRENPFFVRYKLLEISGADGAADGRPTVLSMLKEALTTYGFWSAWKQVENTIVEISSWEIPGSGSLPV